MYARASYCENPSAVSCSTAFDVPATPGRAQDRPAAQRGWCPLPVQCRPGPQPPPNPRRLNATHRRRHPREPALLPVSEPALSTKLAHPALVTVQDFVAAQQIGATRTASDGQHRRFALAGLIHCGVCNRRLTHTGTTDARPTAAATTTPAPNPRTSRDRRATCTRSPGAAVVAAAGNGDRYLESLASPSGRRRRRGRAGVCRKGTEARYRGSRDSSLVGVGGVGVAIHTEHEFDHLSPRSQPFRGNSHDATVRLRRARSPALDISCGTEPASFVYRRRQLAASTGRRLVPSRLRSDR